MYGNRISDKRSCFGPRSFAAAVAANRLLSNGRHSNKLATDYYFDGAFQLEATFHNICLIRGVINAKLSPIKLNKGFKNIYVFVFFFLCLLKSLAAPKISAENIYMQILPLKWNFLQPF